MYTHTYTHMHIYTDAHSRVHTHAHPHIHKLLHTCACTSTHLHTHEHTLLTLILLVISNTSSFIKYYSCCEDEETNECMESFRELAQHQKEMVLGQAGFELLFLSHSALDAAVQY